MPIDVKHLSFLKSSYVWDDKLFLTCELLESWACWNKNIFPLS